MLRCRNCRDLHAQNVALAVSCSTWRSTTSARAEYATIDFDPVLEQKGCMSAATSKFDNSCTLPPASGPTSPAWDKQFASRMTRTGTGCTKIRGSTTGSLSERRGFGPTREPLPGISVFQTRPTIIFVHGQVAAWAGLHGIMSMDPRKRSQAAKLLASQT
jgi:hypothetical protein